MELGGTVSSRHGTGLARTPWVAKQYRGWPACSAELKTIFDPREVFNPAISSARTRGGRRGRYGNR